MNGSNLRLPKRVKSVANNVMVGTILGMVIMSKILRSQIEE